MREPDFITHRSQDSADEVEFFLEIRRKTTLAYLFFDGIDEIWLPQSQIIAIENLGGGNFRVVIPHWLAHKNGMI